MSQENVERVYRAMDAFNRRDLDAFLALADPSVEFTPYVVGLEGSYHGTTELVSGGATCSESSPTGEESL
jgi:hypothetical protein